MSDYDIEDELPIYFIGHELKKQLNRELSCYGKIYDCPKFNGPYHLETREPLLNRKRKRIKRINYKKFVAPNLPLNKSHKKSGHNSFRFSCNPYMNYEKHRESLLKADLYEWAKMNNLPITKKTKVDELVKLLWNM